MTQPNPVPAPVLAYDPISLQAKEIEKKFMIYWICLAAGIPLSVICIGIFGVITSAVFYFMLLYQFWTMLQPSPRTTPGKAIGFMFIPFFNFYWQFVGYYGLVQDMNAAAKARGLAVKPINEQMALAVCICRCVSIIPWLGFLTAIASIVMDILVMKDMKDVAIALLPGTPPAATAGISPA